MIVHWWIQSYAADRMPLIHIFFSGSIQFIIHINMYSYIRIYIIYSYIIIPYYVNKICEYIFFFPSKITLLKLYFQFNFNLSFLSSIIHSFEMTVVSRCRTCSMNEWNHCQWSMYAHAYGTCSISVQWLCTKFSGIIQLVNVIKYKIIWWISPLKCLKII